MSIHSFGKVAAATIVLPALGFLLFYASGRIASPTLMAPWSCAAFVIIGCTIWAASRPSSGHSVAVYTGATLVITIGAVVCFEYLSGSGPTKFDVLIFPASLPRAEFPGRPAPVAGLRFLLLGLVLFLSLSSSTRLVRVREGSAVAVIVLCYFGFVSVVTKWGSAGSTSISPYAALLGILAATSVLVVGKGGLLVPLLRDPGPGGLTARTLMPVALILPVLTTLTRLALGRFRIYDGPSGIAFISMTVLTAIAILWIAASKIRGIDLLRRKAEEELRASRDDLEHRVRLRTRELVEANEHLSIEAANRQRAQTELQQTNAMLASLIENCPLAIAAFDPDGSVRTKNSAAAAMGLVDNAECRALAQRAGYGEAVHAAEVHFDLRGKTLHLHVWASPIVTGAAQFDGVVVMAADVGERLALEAHIQQNQRLESLGVLAGGIAHDFNNILTGILGNASLLQQRFGPDTAEARAAHDLIQAGQAMAKLTSQMLAYAGRSSFRIEPLDLSAEVRRITDLVHAAIPKNARLYLSLAGEALPIEADSSQIQQIVMNLVVNGAEALGAEQGVVEVSTTLRRAEQDELAASVTRPPIPAGEYVVLEVRDTGAGMDEEIVARIFDPFFSTKFTGRGLGLSAVLGIVRSHHAALTVESRRGSGTTFRVFFPRSAKTPETIESVPCLRGSGTILVVDDEEMVLRLAEAVLAGAGYEVLTASNGRDALSVYDARSGRVNAVLLDMAMPIMDGEETMAHLRARWPDAAIIASSGYHRDEAERRFGVRPAGFCKSRTPLLNSRRPWPKS
jgi:signal transduction histidine kinase